MLRPYQTFGQYGDQLIHSITERAESLREIRAACLDTQQRRGTALFQWLEPLTGPKRRPPRLLPHDSGSDPQLGSEGGQLRLSGEKTVRTTLDKKFVAPLGDDHAARASFALEHGHIGTRPRQIPRRGESSYTTAHDDHSAHIQPRSRAAVRTTSATAATGRGRRSGTR